MMRLRILYDNRRISPRFRPAWGFSCLIGNDILFDTGADFKILDLNARALKIDWEQIKHVVISHNHWDHIDGLWGLLKKNAGLKVYLCPGFPKAVSARVRRAGSIPIIVRGWKTLAPGIHLTAQMTGRYKDKPIPERSLVLFSLNGLVIITGCAHAGVLEIVQAAKTRFSGRKIALFLGGFHLKDMTSGQISEILKSLRAAGVQKLMPCHCTGPKALKSIARFYGSGFKAIKAGSTIHIKDKGAPCD